MALRTRSIARRVFREDVKEYLIDAILSGRLKPDERIVETRIAQELGISQAPVREALRDLELFGFVVSEPFRGTHVRQFTHDDLVSIYPVRAALEGVAARSAAIRADALFLEQLTTILDQMRAAARAGNQHAFTESDIAFHRTIVEGSGSVWLHRFWESTCLPVTTLVTVAMGTRPLQDLADRHEPLLAALASGDPGAAETAMRHHIEELGDWVLSALKMQEEDVAETVSVPR